ncbi:hypothetical protein PMKS-000652 [Pichia membranifaciens]|uniref:Uncharacterized protein n=1 Tax=Pichia membranifaciens TaxID=4926 RepID=A0A1Q2YCC5_9ASCO|nr:hypothetical protein PMKS-000652 [Pichia membranifaciens]
MDGNKSGGEDEYEGHDAIDMYGTHTDSEESYLNRTGFEEPEDEWEEDDGEVADEEEAGEQPLVVGELSAAEGIEEEAVGRSEEQTGADGNSGTVDGQESKDEGDDDAGEGDDEDEGDDEEGAENDETVFMVDENGDHIEEQEDYDLDFNEYVGPSDEEDIGETEEYDDEYNNQHETSPGLVVPDVGITRESSMISRITNESDIFANPRKPSVAFPHPSLQTLSEEMKQFSGESDSDFISMVNGGTAKLSRSATTSSTDSDSNRSFGQTDIIDHHNQFISNARYSQSIMSYDDDDDDNDDAFSFQANDDKEYEIGYTPSHEFDDGIVVNDEGDETDTNMTDTESVTEEDAKTPVDEVSNTALPPVPFAPPIMGESQQGGEKNRDSIINAEELQNEVGAMRNQFVRSDMHPSVMSKVTNLVEFTGGDDMPELPKGMLVNGAPVDSVVSDSMAEKDDFEETSITDLDKSLGNGNLGVPSDDELELDKTKSSGSIGLNSRFNKSASTLGGRSLDNSSSISGSTKSLVQPVTPKNIKAGEIFASIPDVDLVQMFTNNTKVEDNIKSLREIRIELSEFDTGITDWISYNMGDSMKINMEDDKLGVHVRKAFKLSEEGSVPSNRNTFTNMGSFSDTVENMAHEFGDFGGRNVIKFKDVVKEVKVKKIGQRGKTLLRKLKKVPEFSSNN